MRHNSHLILKICGYAALFGGILGVAYGIGFPMIDWGRPGTEAYETYQTYNRLELIPLGLQLVAMSYFLWHLRAIIGKSVLGGLTLFILGFLTRIAGVVGEFWIFTAEPYGSELRDNSYALAGIGAMIGLIALVIIGAILWRSKKMLNWFCGFLILSPLLLLTSVLLVAILQPVALDPVTVEGVIQGIIWIVLGVFIFRYGADISLQTTAT
jgi:hypothetical protein